MLGIVLISALVIGLTASAGLIYVAWKERNL
jgi:hypothetical protein